VAHPSKQSGFFEATAQEASQDPSARPSVNKAGNGGVNLAEIILSS